MAGRSAADRAIATWKAPTATVLQPAATLRPVTATMGRRVRTDRQRVAGAVCRSATPRLATALERTEKGITTHAGRAAKQPTLIQEESTMNKNQRAALRRFRRVQEFLSTNPVAGAAGELGKQARVLAEVIQKISQDGEEMDASARLSRAETTRQRALRTTLRDRHMQPISRIARLVYGIPGMDRAFYMPRNRADNDALLAAARGMAQAAAKHPDVFVEHGLPTTFIDDLRGATSELADALGARVENQRRRTVAVQSLTQQVKRGVTAVLMLDAVVTPRLTDDPELLASWQTVKRPIEAGGTAPPATPAAPDATAAAPQEATPQVKAA